MEWIEFKEKKPEELEQVIFLASRHEDWNYSGDKKLFQNRQFIGFICNYECDDISCVFGDGFVPFSIEDVTHWMPLPDFPE